MKGCIWKNVHASDHALAAKERQIRTSEVVNNSRSTKYLNDKINNDSRAV
jgi:hypothetical protein